MTEFISTLQYVRAECGNVDLLTNLPLGRSSSCRLGFISYVRDKMKMTKTDMRKRKFPAKSKKIQIPQTKTGGPRSNRPESDERNSSHLYNFWPTMDRKANNINGLSGRRWMKR